MEPQDLFYIFIVIVFFYVVTRKACETFEATIVQNPFTDLMCITDDLKGDFNDVPVFRIKNEGTFECLSRDGKSCLMRNNFDIPSDARCTTFFGKDGIRNLSGRNKEIFDEFERGSNPNGSFLSCSPDSIKNTGHWCGKLSETFLKECKSNVGFKSKYNYTCEDINRYKAKEMVNREYNVISRDQIQANRQKAIQATQSVRSGNASTPPPPPPPPVPSAVAVAVTGAVAGRSRRVA
ncbi:hypothetical protein EB118_03565 [bacterium]|nr:hypothetical protein [bacterium]NDC94058.1 hypothetical protein [bacterium]NDD82744.1 hypothetical protein [bacterium]NDG29164.1 hypothetical protein [bacterium]